MAKYLLLSDPHFGCSECSLYERTIRKALFDFMKQQISFEKVILLGDVLDVNYGSFTEALFGTTCADGKTPQIGFADWVKELFGGENFSVTEIVYLPGNHDYKVWDLLATEKNFMKPLAAGGETFKKSNLLFADRFDDSFFEGVVPLPIRQKFYVQYPDIELKVKGKTIFATHGHYLCRIQTFGATMPKMIKKYGDQKTARRKFFQSTARYQAGANAISFQKEWRAAMEKYIGKADSFWDWVTGKNGLRDKPIDKDQLLAMEEYLHLYCGKYPDVFIFGHTHVPGYANTGSGDFGRYKRLIPNKNIQVWNTGHFLKKNKVYGSFILIDDQAEKGKEIQLFTVNKDGTIKLYMEGGVQ